MAWYTPHWPFKQQWEPDPLLVSDVHTVPPPTVRLQPYPPALTAGGQGWPEWPAPPNCWSCLDISVRHFAS